MRPTVRCGYVQTRRSVAVKPRAERCSARRSTQCFGERQPLLSPVGVGEVHQQGELVEDEARTDTERHAEVQLAPVRTGEDRRDAGSRRDKDPGRKWCTRGSSVAGR
jgi:hypothetical protein